MSNNSNIPEKGQQGFQRKRGGATPPKAAPIRRGHILPLATVVESSPEPQKLVVKHSARGMISNALREHDLSNRIPTPGSVVLVIQNGETRPIVITKHLAYVAGSDDAPGWEGHNFHDPTETIRGYEDEVHKHLPSLDNLPQGPFPEDNQPHPGQQISYQSGYEQRNIIVTSVDDDIKNGLPGFDGIMVDNLTDKVWGYTEQIIQYCS